MSQPDPRPRRRVRDPELLRNLHIYWRGWCVLEEHGGCEPEHYSLHHVHKHPRDDLRVNLVMLCGHGTAGHHGRIEAHDREACQALYAYIAAHRLDTLGYLREKLGPTAAQEWLRDQLYAPI